MIDYLQEWNFDKKAESFIKRNFKGRPRDLISCVPPTLYCQRFNRFVSTEVLATDDRATERVTYTDSNFSKPNISARLLK